ncbi:MAG: hypothetical protein KGL53_04470, partial [Elusimicrobia bacterium]|nr:hypothetical protein [Elusimicrobiota bacterium]
MSLDARRFPADRLAACALAVVLSFAAAAQGGRDLWAATPVYLAVLALAAAVFAWRTWGQDAPGYRLALPLPLAVLAAALALSGLGAVNKQETVGALLDWAAALAAYLTAVNVFEEDGALDAFLMCSLPIVLVEAALAFGQRWPGWTRHPRPMLYLATYASTGTLGNANTATAFVLPWLAVLAAKRRDAAGAARRAWTWALAGAG